MSTATSVRPAGRPVREARPPARRRGVFVLVAVLIVMPLLVAAGLLAWPLLQRDEHAQVALDAATSLYNTGQYDLAAHAFEQLVEQGVDAPSIYFNLGVTSLQAGEFTAAVDSLQRAHAQSPRDEAISQALQGARNSLAVQANASGPIIAEPGAFVGSPADRVWMQWLSANEIALIALGAWSLLAWMIVLVVRRRRGRGWALAGAALAVVVLLAAGGALVL